MAEPPQHGSRHQHLVLAYAGLFKLHDWIVLGPLAFLGLALGIWGFALCRECGVSGFLPMLAKSVGLVRGSGSYSLGQHPWQLVVAQFLLPGLALFGAAKLLLVNLRRDLRVALARRQRNHTIVCGLGDTGRQIVENLRARGGDVVAVTLDTDEANAVACERLGVAVLAGDASQIEMLWLAGLRRASAVVAAAGSDAVNIEIALRIAAAFGTPARRARPLCVLPEVRSAWLLELLRGHPTATLSTEAVETRPFDLQTIAARLLLQSDAFHAVPAAGTAIRPHLLIAGLGEMGTQIILHAVRTRFALPEQRIAVSVFDQQGKDCAAPLAARFPGLEGLVDLELVETSFAADSPGSWPSVWQSVEEVLERRGEGVSTVAAIVALKEDKDALHAALQLRERLDRRGRTGTPVFVRLRQQRQLGHFAAGLDGPNTLIDRLIPFGDLGVLTSPEILFDEVQDRLAQAVHATYLETEGGAGGGDAAVPWARLPERFKQSNRAFADHIAVKLGYVGLRLAAGKEPPAALSEAEIEAMSAAEHWRWTLERLSLGWSHGERRDDLARRHPWLVAWQQLDERVREQNRAMIRGIPKAIAIAGMTIRRQRIIVALGEGIAAAAAALDAVKAGEQAVVVFDPRDPQSWAFAQQAASRRAKLWVLWREGSRQPLIAPSPPPQQLRAAIEIAISTNQLGALEPDATAAPACAAP